MLKVTEEVDFETLYTNSWEQIGMPIKGDE